MIRLHVMRLSLPILFICLVTSASSAQWPGQVPPDDVPVYVPEAYDPDVAMPLLIFLHGYAPLTTAWYDILLPLQEVANSRGYIYSKPDGSQDGLGEFYWNATDACCDMWGNDPDHVGYLLALLDSIESNYNIDPRRIHLIGHSNGGFMCHRMACEVSERLASVVSISGAMWNDEESCQPADPVHVLQIHGTFDPVILWLGGYIGLTPYPGANTTAEFWAAHNGCSATATNGGSFDLDWLVFFDETTRWIYGQCTDSTAGSSELWEVFAGGHLPSFSDEGIQVIFDYLDAHVRPPGACVGDANGDHAVDVTDLLQVVGDWGGSDSSADVNADGVVDVSDLLIVVGNWGTCS
ncbi:MAG: alpha/beta hydrolase-fold protein [Phycisphaerales bacterium]|nr:alpha/beta hydrolase-fold protein [Phycisphaerales bacterium]